MRNSKITVSASIVIIIHLGFLGMLWENKLRFVQFGLKRGAYPNVIQYLHVLNPSSVTGFHACAMSQGRCAQSV